ncbi:MAG: alpha/beta hydrolase [Luminiphilus sp.]
MKRFLSTGPLLCGFLLTSVSSADEVIVKRGYVDLEWGQIHLRTAHPVNSSDATPVVCFAPTPYSGNYYKLLMKELARDRVVIAPDYPGLGQSDRPDTDLEVADHADIMAEVLIAAGWGPTARGPVDACGYHTGTFIATELALRHPALIRRLVLIGVPFYQGAERAERYERLGGVRPLPESLAALEQDWSFTVEKRAQGVALERGFENFIESAAAWQNKSRLYGAVFQYPAEQRAPLLMHPTLVLNPHGNLEGPSRDFSSLIPNAQVVELPDLKYGIFDTAPDVIASHSRAFLDRP